MSSNSINEGGILRSNMPFSLPRMCQSFVQLRVARVLALVLLLIGVMTYRSFEHHDVLGKWSYPFAGVVLGVMVLVGVSIGSCLRRGRAGACTTVSSSAALADFGLLLWGGGYLISALDNQTDGGRIADLNVIGSAVPMAAMLEWVALTQAGLAAGLILWKYRESKWINLGLALWSMAALLLLGEGVARIARCIEPVVQGFPTYSSTLWTRQHVRLNQAGFRDEDHRVSRDPRSRRLLVVGDSYAYGWGIKKVEDRFGELLALRLRERTGIEWESMNASRPDTHTLDHLKFLQSMVKYKPDLIVLLYVFNDIDYMKSVTSREGVSEAPISWFDRANPFRLLFKNSFLFQELYVRSRLMSYRFPNNGENGYDPYRDSSLLKPHIGDLIEFVSIGVGMGGLVVVVPFDISTVADAAVRTRYRSFVEETTKVGIPTLPIDNAFAEYRYDQLTVNALDRHPNEYSNRLAADAVDTQLAELPSGALIFKKADNIGKGM